MNNMRLFKKSLLAVTVTLATQQAFAAGFQLNAQSATGLGRAFAGDAVIADNAAVMSRNPAAMALFDEMALSLGFETITTDIKVKNATYTSPTGQKNANYDDAGGTSVAPNIHLIVPVNEQFAWGVNAYSNFGTRTEFEKNYVASEYGGETEILSVNLGVSGSYRIDNQWSVGAGLDLIYGQGTLKRAFSDTFYTGPVTTNPTTGMLKALNGRSVVDISKADGFGIGFNVGTVYELDENNRFGLSYRYSPTITAKDGDKEVKLPLPDLAEFSGYHRIENTAFAVHYSIQYIGWSAFDKLEFKNQSINEKPYQWQDGWHYSIGGTYYLNRDWTLRTGYMYDTSAQDKITSISVPDSDRQWLSAGFTYRIDEKSNFDLGLTYLMGKDVKVEEKTTVSSISATTHADAILFGLQYSRTF
ncbi:outer membrane protein transport protein [Vibrio cholerae]|uniref:outer membrane protein transport protein n=1 Tax=Vibrio cholerae TaxID=666 RepID=UPI0011D532BE|nr:outer membrane protein transport protein [Vibrio cholerae]TXX37619.1 outer membrane protein transport protein [Vibrio cholerae]BCK02787.1 Long-chain fatty acid transport protein [Vibrio cholerae]GHW70060.1 long-chain fatty acid transport protein [Vibrio cholerae]